LKERAYLHAMRGGSALIIPVMFNPTELTVAMSAKASGQGGNVQFQRFGKDDFKVDLFFDTYETRSDVRDWTRPIVGLMAPTEGTQIRKVPPTVTFMWPSNVFCGFIKQVVPKYTMFLEDGTPVRAELSVTFQELLTPQAELAVQGYAGGSQVAMARSGQRLDLLAQEMCGDRSQWQAIASANGIRDALNFPQLSDIGRVLSI
jgi:hypothetical protein